MTTTESILETVPSHARGLSILLVDCDPSSLIHMASLLEQYSFKVTLINIASDALKLLNKKKIPFDLVMANLEKANIESVAIICPLLMNNTPFILFSYEGDKSAGKRTLDEVTYCTFKKPVALVDLKDIWQHAFTKKTYKKEAALMKEPSRPARASRSDNINNNNNGSSLQETDMLKNMDNNKRGCSKIVNNLEPRAFPKRSTTATAYGLKGKDPLIVRDYPDSLATLIPLILNEDGRRWKGIQTNDKNVNREVFPGGSIGTREMMNKGKGALIVEECLGSSSEAFKLMTKRLINEISSTRQGKRPRTNHDKFDPKRSSTVTEGGSSRRAMDVIRNNTGCKPRPRAVWTSELHRKFVEALTKLGDKNARPKKILRMMNVPNLTQRQVGSHLQKYKAQVQRICENTAIDAPSASVTRSAAAYGGSDEPSQWMPPYQLEQEGFDLRSQANAIDIPSLPENVSTLESDPLQLQNQNSGYPSFSSLTGNLSWPYGGYNHDQLQGNFYVVDQQSEMANLNGTTPHDLQNCIAKDSSLDLPSIESNNSTPFGFPSSNNGMVSTVFPEVEQIDPPPELTSSLGSGLAEMEAMPFATTLTTVMPCEGGGKLEEIINFSGNTEPQQEMPSWSEIFKSSSTGYLPIQETALNFCSDIPNLAAYPYGFTGQQQTMEMDNLTSADVNQPLNPPNDAASMVFPVLAGNTEGGELNIASLQSSTSHSEFPTVFISTVFSTAPMEVETGYIYIPDFADEQDPQWQLEFPSEITNSTVVSMPLQPEGQMDYDSNFAGSLDQGEHASFWTESSVATNENSNHFSSKNESSAMLEDGKQDSSQMFAGEASNSFVTPFTDGLWSFT